MSNGRAMLAWLLSVLMCSSLLAAVTTREDKVNDRRTLVLENELIRMVVLPDPGGTVIEFTYKPTGVNHVAGGDRVLAGRMGFGWKDYYWLEDPAALGKGIFALPYHAEFREGAGYKAIYVSCEAEGRRFEREMRLSDNSAQLTTLIKVTNISNAPLRLQARWHTYSTLDDVEAKNSCIIAPGEDGQARKCFIGSGYDHQFIVADGYWLAANYANGSGMWMTFNKDHNSMQITWTDYNPSRKGPTRGMYIAEPHPQSKLAAPGESIAYDSTFYPFTAKDKPESIPLGMLTDPKEQARARQFLSDVLPNLAAIGPFTMTPGNPPAGEGKVEKPNGDNRFEFSHRRRDRFALRPWGIVDAMIAVGGAQDTPIRARYYARLFDHISSPTKVTFRLRAVDVDGKVALEQAKDFTIDPAKSRELDERDDIAIAALPDGWYEFQVQGVVQGESEPIHTYIERRQMVGRQRPAYDAALAQREAGPLVERPFVTALRTVELPAGKAGDVTVPIGIEDGSGIARKQWPVRLGVPFAQGMVAKNARIEVLDPSGKSVPVQASPMATWMDGSVKWMLLDFQADVPADGHVFYTAKATGASAAESKPLAQMNGDKPVVAGSPLAGKPELLLGLFGPQDLWWKDAVSGQTFYFRVQGEESGVVIEENGPNRAVIKATGWYVNEQGQSAALGELRLEHYRGQPFVRLYHSVTYTGDPWRQKLGGYGARLHLPGAGYSSAAVELDGKIVSGRQVALSQRNPARAQVTADGQVTSGQRSIGAVQLQAKAGALTVYQRNFWQMAPKSMEIDASAGTVSIDYWPSSAGAMSFLPREDGWIPSSSSAEAIAVGMGRTHEIILDFGSTQAVTAFENLHSEPVVAIVPPRYLTQTKAMNHLSPYDPTRHPTMEKVLSNTTDFYESQRQLWGWYGQWTYGGIPNFWRPNEYRWFDFGRYAWILNEQDIVETPWLCYMRSGDRKHLKFAESNTRHMLEVATIRWNKTWPQFEGMSRRHHECIWLAGGDFGHSMLDPFLDYYYSTGYKPAGDAAVRMAKAMATTTSGSWRYISNPTAGLARMYLDTQNPFYKEHADRIWNTLCYPEQNTWWVMDHGDRMVMWYSQINPQCKELVKAWALDQGERKDRFTGADILTGLYLETGEARYAEAAAKLVPKTRPMEITQYVLAKMRAACYAGHLPPEKP
jgi:hypothetical protein